nr:hypothetical protein [Serratia proteamaculans]
MHLSEEEDAQKPLTAVGCTSEPLDGLDAPGVSKKKAARDAGRPFFFLA